LKKTLSVLAAFVLFFQWTYSYVPVECKAAYVAGSTGIKLNTSGVLQVGENSLIFIYRGNRYEIPYENITQIQYSQRKEAVSKISFDKPNPPGVSFGYYHRADLEQPGAVMAVIISAIIALGVLIIQLIKISKRVYLNVVYEKEGETNWAIFKIKKDDFQKILLTLSSKSGIEIQER
jgi:energy-coupling factor transporter transmembrane protein EcfT